MGKRAVVVEDDEIILEFLEMVFATETIDVIRARDGTRGLEMISEYRPDIVICDMHMSGISGLDVLQAMKKDPDTATIPFVMISVDENPAIRRRSLDSGADAFVLKPFDPETLVQTLLDLMERAKQVPDKDAA